MIPPHSSNESSTPSEHFLNELILAAHQDSFLFQSLGLARAEVSGTTVFDRRWRSVECPSVSISFEETAWVDHRSLK